MNLEEYKSVNKWLSDIAYERSGSLNTKKMYLTVLKNFCRFVGKTPDQLVSDCSSEVKIRKFVEQIKAFTMKEGRAKGTVVLYTTVLKSFFDHNGVHLPIRRIQNWVTYEDRAITQDEIHKILQVSDLRAQVEIAILAQSGMRIGTLARLTNGHVREGLEKGEVPLCIHISAELTKGRVKSYQTFIGPESINLLKLYFHVRKVGTKKIPGEQFTDTNPLLRHHGKKEVIPIGPHCIYDDIRKALLQTGLAEKTGKPNELRPHSLRKFFKTQLETAGVPRTFIEHMMGHKLPGSESRYFKPTKEQLKEAYMKGLPFLSLTRRKDVEDEFKRVLQTVKAKRREPDIIKFVDKILEALTEEKVYSEAPFKAYFNNNNTMNVCPKCKNPADSDALVCDQCGEKLRIECSRCNTLNKLTSNYCKKCRNKIGV